MADSNMNRTPRLEFIPMNYRGIIQPLRTNFSDSSLFSTHEIFCPSRYYYSPKVLDLQKSI